MLSCTLLNKTKLLYFFFMHNYIDKNLTLINTQNVNDTLKIYFDIQTTMKYDSRRAPNICFEDMNAVSDSYTIINRNGIYNTAQATDNFTSVRHEIVVSGCTHLCCSCECYLRPCCLHKRCILKTSSNYPYGSFPGSNAVNGLLSDLAHTSLEKSPWLRIDLGARFLIHEIEVFARSDHLGKH